MKISTMKALSTTMMAAGNLSIIASLVLYADGRSRRDIHRLGDALFVGLWAPSFFVLADRFATEAVDKQERMRYGEPELVDQYEEEPQVISPRPMAHVGR